MLSAMTRLPGSSHIRSEKGFTLLELLMVVTILSTVAWMALDVVDNRNDQVRFEDTRNRLDAIKRAIIGDSSRTVNGHPMISGYVADMGELPPRLKSLVSNEYCADHPEISTGKDDCENAGHEWVSHPLYQYYGSDENPNEDFGFWSGWRGPYLSMTDYTGGKEFRDGWWNRAETDGEDDSNFGWKVEVDSGDMAVTSRGKDNADGSIGPDIYEADYPSGDLIVQSQYTLEATDSNGNGGLVVAFNQSACWACTDTDADGKLLAHDVDKRSDCLIATTTSKWTPILGIEASGDCLAMDVDGDSDTDGVWLKTEKPSGVCWLSESDYGDQTSCEDTAGEAWQWISNGSNRVPVCIDLDKDSVSCIDTGRGEAWVEVAESEPLCLKMAVRANGKVDDTTILNSDLPARPFFWDGSRQLISFPFPSGSTHLAQGQAAIRIYEYDSTEDKPCTDTPFYGGTARWKTFTILPGTLLQPLEWDVE